MKAGRGRKQDEKESQRVGSTAAGPGEVRVDASLRVQVTRGAALGSMIYALLGIPMLRTSEGSSELQSRRVLYISTLPAESLVSVHAHGVGGRVEVKVRPYGRDERTRAIAIGRPRQIEGQEVGEPEAR